MAYLTQLSEESIANSHSKIGDIWSEHLDTPMNNSA